MSRGPAVQRAMMVRGGGSGGVFIGAVLDDLDAASRERAFEAFGERVGIIDMTDHRELGRFRRAAPTQPLASWSRVAGLGFGRSP
jgi:hypothetical protein